MNRPVDAQPQAPIMVPPPEALLCALALDPTSFSRNRHHWMYTVPEARAAHARARSLRRLVRQLVPMVREGRRLDVRTHGGGMRIRYRDARLALSRMVALTPLEASLVRWLLRRELGASSTAWAVGAEDRERLVSAINTLSPRGAHSSEG